MVLINKQQLPDHLKNSSLGKVFLESGEDEEELEIPENCLKLNFEINSPDDLDFMCSTIRFWGLVDLPETLIDYMMNSDKAVYKDVVQNYGEQLRFLRFFEMYDKELIQTQEQEAMLCAVRTNSIDMVKYLCKRLGCKIYPAHTIDAASCGNLEFLKDYGKLFDRPPCLAAVEGNQPECLKYMLSKRYTTYVGEAVFEKSVELGRLHCLLIIVEKMVSRGVNKKHLWRTLHLHHMAEKGFLDCLKFACEECGAPWDAKLCARAAQGGHLNVLQYLHEKGCPWDLRTCITAARSGSFPCLQYAREQGCDWNAQVPNVCAEYNHLSCLEYVLSQGCPLDWQAAAGESAFAGSLEGVQMIYCHAVSMEEKRKNTLTAEPTKIGFSRLIGTTKAATVAAAPPKPLVCFAESVAVCAVIGRHADRRLAILDFILSETSIPHLARSASSTFPSALTPTTGTAKGMFSGGVKQKPGMALFNAAFAHGDAGVVQRLLAQQCPVDRDFCRSQCFRDNKASADMVFALGKASYLDQLNDKKIYGAPPSPQEPALKLLDKGDKKESYDGVISIDDWSDII